MDETSLYREKIQKWIEANSTTVAALNPLTIHITDLFPGYGSKEEILERSLMAYEILIAEIYKLQIQLKPGLVLPLVSDWKQIKRRFPKTREELLLNLSDEPPSLVLESWESPKKAVIMEEFKCPLGFELVEYYPEEIYSYYREHRYWMAIKNNWEYTRGVYLEFYPERKFFS